MLTFFYVLGFVLVIVVLLKFGKLLIGLMNALRKAKVDAKIYRNKLKAQYKEMATDQLHQKLLNNEYLISIKKARILDWLIKDIDNGREKNVAGTLTESKLYDLFAKAEHELGRYGRPEAIDFTPEIWDLIEELGMR